MMGQARAEMKAKVKAAIAPLVFLRASSEKDNFSRWRRKEELKAQSIGSRRSLSLEAAF